MDKRLNAHRECIHECTLLALTSFSISLTLAVWHGGNGVAHINEVTLRQTRLVLRQMTIPPAGILSVIGI